MVGGPTYPTRSVVQAILVRLRASSMSELDPVTFRLYLCHSEHRQCLRWIHARSSGTWPTQSIVDVSAESRHVQAILVRLKASLVSPLNLDMFRRYLVDSEHSRCLRSIQTNSGDICPTQSIVSVSGESRHVQTILVRLKHRRCLRSIQTNSGDNCPTQSIVSVSAMSPLNPDTFRLCLSD